MQRFEVPFYAPGPEGFLSGNGVWKVAIDVYLLHQTGAGVVDYPNFGWSFLSCIETDFATNDSFCGIVKIYTIDTSFAPIQIQNIG